jgi:hypothetical protein
MLSCLIWVSYAYFVRHLRLSHAIIYHFLLLAASPRPGAVVAPWIFNEHVPMALQSVGERSVEGIQKVHVVEI